MDQRFKTGETVGDYQIEGFIGAGGMGEVYKGVHTRLKRSAAIKSLNVTSLNESLVRRFNNEARLQSTLHHPNIATLYDYQQIDGRLCIFMEYVDGESLEDLIERRFFAVDEALKVFYEIVEAVSFTHSQGIVHRDIKSQNIKFTSSGSPKLLDFGIAKDSASANLTKEGGVIGTPNYLAPEQLHGVKASPVTDVWALGVLLYEMLTGEKPFRADTIGGLCEQIKSSKFEAVEKLNSAVPGLISKAVEKCLCKDPKKRYQNAPELLNEIAKTLETLYGVPVKPDGRSNEAFGNEAIPGFSGPKIVGIALSLIGFFVFIALGSYAIWSLISPAEKGERTENSTVVDPLSSKPIPEETESEETPFELPAQKNEILSEDNLRNRKIDSQQVEKELSQITIDVIGGSADVVRNGSVLGKTPFDLKAPEGSVVSLILKRAGYADKKIEVEVMSNSDVYTFVLKSK